MKNLLLTLCLISAFYINAQEKKVDAWKYAKTISSGDLATHLKIIASDEFEGRETGKKGQKLAMNYLIEQFKRFGINDYEGMNYIQTYPLVEQENKGIELIINDRKFIYNSDFAISPSIIKKTQISGDLVFIGYGIDDEEYSNYTNIDVRNKAVFIMPGVPEKKELNKEWSLKEKIDFATERGAAVVFYYNEKLKENLSKYEHYYKKPKLSLKADVKDETIIVSATTEMTEYILKQGKLKFKKINKKGIKESAIFTTNLQLKIDKPTQELTGENVIAFIPGTEKKEEIIAITAHYDHIGKSEGKIFNGADDDGSGTVSLIEIAEAFQKAVKEGNGPKRSILIMPVSGEEKGLLGSRYYTDNPIFPLENTVVDLNIDMIGRYDKDHENDSNYVYLIGADKLSQELHDISEEVNKKCCEIGLDYTFNDENDPNRFYYRSDHYNFAKNNIPVIFYFNGVHADYHKATDTVEKIDYEKTKDIARLVFMTAWELANRDERIKLNEPEKSNEEKN